MSEIKYSFNNALFLVILQLEKQNKIQFCLILKLMFPVLESYFSVLMLFGASQAVTGIFILLRKENKPFSNNLLALLLFSWGFSCYWFFAFIHGTPFFSVPVTTFIGPMLSLTLFPPIFLYVKYLFYEYNRFQKIDHLHFLPIYLYLLFTLYLFADSGFSINNMRAHEWYRVRMMASSYLATLLGPFYFIKTNQILKLRQQQLEAHFSEIESRKLQWFKTINYSFALVFIIGGASTIVNFYVNPFLLYMGYHAVIAICLFYINLMIFKHPLIFKKLEIATLNPPRSAVINEEREISATIQNSPEQQAPDENKKEKRVIDKIAFIMTREKLYKNPNFNLNDLSEAISESRNSISHALNHGLNKTFYTYINELRIEESKKLLLDPSLENYTIEGIAAESGFKTISVFYKFFKDSEKMTPAVFRKKTSE